MAKAKETAFFCKECGYESSKWQGQCPACKSWNSFTEERIVTGNKKSSKSVIRHNEAKPVTITEISGEKDKRFVTGIGEFDRVLGGGIVPGSLILVGGDPGIGKSTLLLQVCRLLSEKEDVLYISGEESLSQIKLRADRIGKFNDSFKLLCETDLSLIEEVLKKEKPALCVIDSIQTMADPSLDGVPGSVSQVRESTVTLMRLAKEENISILIIGHVTKEGMVAGPRVLEHMVDTVLYFEGDKQDIYRMLRGVKNRFGSTNEVGVFEMCEEGLIEVKNPSEFMISGKPANASGSVVTCTMEGTRPMLMEVQALIGDSSFQIPRRSATGLDFNRLNLLIAVMEKRAGMNLSREDAYVNFAGGIKVTEPSTDLAVVMAICSSFRNVPVPDDMIIFGEVGLSGEVRGVSGASKRIDEARKLGYKTVVLPAANKKTINSSSDISLIFVQNITEAMGVIR